MRSRRFSILALVPAALWWWACGRDADVELIGWAMLPADTFVDGPTSGQFIEPVNGRTPPFTNKQPVQGFSALIADGEEGAFLALPDNGFGTKENSSDFLLRVYRLRPHFMTAEGGPGTIEVESLFLLRDPDHQVPFDIIADGDRYPDSDIDVPQEIRSGRLLTGADFDIESFRRVADGTFYFGDEFGPFLLHTDSTGRVLEPPVGLPGVRSPQSPDLGDDAPNLPRSGGFEGMAMSEDGLTLFPMLEQPLRGETWVNIYAFDVTTNQYRQRDPGAALLRFRLDSSGVAVTELTRWRGDNDYLVIERDEGQGPTAHFKKVLAVNFRNRDANGYLAKTEIVDLLDIPDPHDVAGTGRRRLAYPFETPEALIVLDDSTIGILNDNNYPMGLGRHVGAGQPDDSEFILVRMRR